MASTPTRRRRVVSRSWLVVGCGAATSAVVLASWLPVGALLTQHAAISAAETHLAQLNGEGKSLAAQVKQLAQPRYQLQLFRARYQLVEPGQRLIEVLHVQVPSGASTSDGPYRGDPGFTPIVNPVTGSVVTPSSSSRAASGSGSFVSRVLGTLEFWR